MFGRQSLLHSAFLLASLSFFALCMRVGALPNEQYIAIIWLPLMIYLGLTILRRFSFFWGAWLDKRNKRLRESVPEGAQVYPFVTIIVPAYNEERVIERSLKSLLALEYPNFEVIVVDDGSRDQTPAIVTTIAEESAAVIIRLIRRRNGGKAAALNTGLSEARGDLIFCVDADSVVSPQALKAGVKHFADPEVGAVAGFIEVANQDSLLTKMQEIEYLVGLNLLRRGLGVLGVVPIVPGPAGLFRREVFGQSGGFEDRLPMFAEDAEMSMRIISKGWKINSEEDMIAFTEAPETVRDLLRQRYRWTRGVFQAWRQNLTRLLDNGGWRGMVLCSHLFAEIYIVAIVNLGLMLMFLTHFLVTNDVSLFMKWFVALILIEALSIAVSVHRHGSPLKWMAVGFFSQFSYTQMLIIWRVLCLFEEWFRVSMAWDKLARSGHLEGKAL